MVDHVIINGSRFDLWGVSNHDVDLHLNIRQREGYTSADVQAAIEAGEEPILVYNSKDELQYTFVGFTTLRRIMVDYAFKFTPGDVGTAIQVVISRKEVTASDITDIQLAIAELAALITEAE